MVHLLLTVFVIIVVSVLYGYFHELNPGSVALRLSPTAGVDLSPASLVLISMAAGALLVTLLVGIRETKFFILNWRSLRLRRRQ